MQTLTRPPKTTLPAYKPHRPAHRKRFSLRMFIGMGVTLVVVLTAGFFFIVRPLVGSHAADAAVNMDCTLIVPPDPLTAQGLATPYKLKATNRENGPCNEANPNQAAFVQAAVIDPVTGQLSIYDPLVTDKGKDPAVPPVVPQLPQGGIVGIWFGFNGNNLTLQDNNGSLNAGNCVNGADGTIFTQFAYCNAPAFFQTANQAIQAGKLVPPALGTAKDGMPCPTVRDFGVVDQDQSDNVTTTYLVTGNGQTAQMTAANAAALQNTQTQTNASDNRLLDVALDGALGCIPWMVPDLADPGHTATALPLNESQAAVLQAAPVALVPNRDPMVLNNNQVDINKVNAYRIGVDQPLVQNTGMSSTRTYCQNLVNIAPQRMALDRNLTQNSPSPSPMVANSLFTFLAQRFVTTFGANGLNCMNLLKMKSPVTVQTDGNGVAISAQINGNGDGNGNGGGNGGNGGTTTPPNCTVNGTLIANCTGTTVLNGQLCSFSFANNNVTVTCPAAINGQQQPGLPQNPTNGNGNGQGQNNQNGQQN